MKFSFKFKKIAAILVFIVPTLTFAGGMEGGGGHVNIIPLSCEFIKNTITSADEFVGFRIAIQGVQTIVYNVDAYGLNNGVWSNLNKRFNDVKPTQLFNKFAATIPDQTDPTDGVIRFHYRWFPDLGPNRFKHFEITFNSDGKNVNGSYDAVLSLREILTRDQDERIEGKCYIDVLAEANPFPGK